MSDDLITSDSCPAPDDPPPEAPPQPRFDTEPYRIANGGPAGILLFLVGLPAVGLVIGLLTSVPGQWIYLPVLFPIGMGVLAAFAGRWLLRATGARSPVFLWTATVLTAVVMMVGVHYGDFLFELKAADAKIPGILQVGVSDPRYFGRYMETLARRGFTVTVARMGVAHDIHFNYAGTYLFWVAEAGIAGAIIFLMLRPVAGASFCGECRRWIPDRVLGKLPDGPPVRAGGPLRGGRLLTLLEQAEPDGELGLMVLAAVCPSCGPGPTIDVGVARVTREPNGEKVANYFYRVRYPADVLAFLDARSKPA
jgi:hypothetical protein